MKKLTILLSTMLLFATLGYSQVAINTDGSNADSSAMLDIKSSTKGLLLPRMTTIQISSISNPAAGLLVYNTDSSDFYGYNGSKWISLWNTSDTISPWVCGDPITDSRDGQSYTTVQIATQCWMAENLNIGTVISGSSHQLNNGVIEKYCYNDDTANCDVYGGLYLWDEMMQYVTTEGTQGICPSGWHLPSDSEWMTLEEEVESVSGVNWNTTGPRGYYAGSNLKETGTSHWYSPNNGATNFSGFTGLPGGKRYPDGTFSNLTALGYWWTSSELDAYSAWNRSLHYDDARVFRYTEVKSNFGFSVRCQKD